MASVQRWPYFVQPTKCKQCWQRDILSWPNVGPLLWSQHNKSCRFPNSFSTCCCWPNVGPTFVPNANYKTTVQRFANVGPTKSCYLGFARKEHFRPVSVVCRIFILQVSLTVSVSDTRLNLSSPGSKHHQLEFTFSINLNLCAHGVSTYAHNILNCHMGNLNKW